MTYDARELSAAEGRPVELYIFTRGSNTVWRYTSADRDLLVDGNVYTARTINRSPIEQGQEIARSNQKLRVEEDFPIAALYNVAPPSDPIYLQLRQFHYDDTEVKTLWQGEISNVGFENDEAIIDLTPSSAVQAMGLPRLYQKMCPFVLYGPDCKAVSASFRVTGPVDSFTGSLTVNVSEADALADGHFDGGYLEWLVATDTYERRFIHSHVGAALTLDLTPLGLTVGTEVRIYPGCDHTLATCNAKFANALNYCGMPYTPQKNPFGGDPVF